MQKLLKFTVTEDGQGFSLHIAGEAGDVLELSATREQIDVIADGLDELLSQDDSADEIADDEGIDDDEIEDDDLEDDELDDDEDAEVDRAAR